MMRYLISCLLAAAAICGPAYPADARLGDSVTDAREMARHYGAQSVKLFTDHALPDDPSARVIAVTWVAPEAGWTLDEANAYLKLLVGQRRRIMVKTSRVDLSYVYTFRYQDEIAARCVYEQSRVREITATAPTFIEADAVEATFVFP